MPDDCVICVCIGLIIILLILAFILWLIIRIFTAQPGLVGSGWAVHNLIDNNNNNDNEFKVCFGVDRRHRVPQAHTTIFFVK